MARRTRHPIGNLSELRAYEAALDEEICGFSLAEEGETRFAIQGAHDPTPTHYFMLDELFAHLPFDASTHLLDVGCGKGRVLAYFLQKGLSGRATGIELDPELAAIAQSWASRYETVRVLKGNVLDIDLSPYNVFYLYNPFAPHVLDRFIESLEWQVARPIYLIHMADNGDEWQFERRTGWSALASGSIEHFRNDRGFKVEVYDYPQHYTIWHYEGAKSNV